MGARPHSSAQLSARSPDRPPAPRTATLTTERRNLLGWLNRALAALPAARSLHLLNGTAYGGTAKNPASGASLRVSARNGKVHLELRSATLAASADFSGDTRARATA